MRFATMVMGLAGVSLLGCTGGGTVECGAEECAAFCEDQAAAMTDPAGAAADPAPEPTGGVALTDFEEDMISPHLEDIRGGVRPFDDEGIGICRGERKCDEYLGREVGELPPGDYIVKAELRVPKVGEEWTVEFQTECETVRKTESGETRSTSENSRTYDVRYAGEQRGYRLMPLRTIESPSRGGSRECSWKLIAPHPDGDKVYEGSWSTPSGD